MLWAWSEFFDLVSKAKAIPIYAVAGALPGAGPGVPAELPN